MLCALYLEDILDDFELYQNNIIQMEDTDGLPYACTYRKHVQ